MGQKEPLPCSGAAIAVWVQGGPHEVELHLRRPACGSPPLPADPPRATPLSLLASRGSITITVNVSQCLVSHFTLGKMGKLFKWDH